MLRIWGRSNSINVQKGSVVLRRAGPLAYQRVDLGGAFGGNREPEYLRLNLNGLVPTISDGGFVLWESNAIVRYLAAKHGCLLCPETSQSGPTQTGGWTGRWVRSGPASARRLSGSTARRRTRGIAPSI